MALDSSTFLSFAVPNSPQSGLRESAVATAVGSIVGGWFPAVHQPCLLVEFVKVANAAGTRIISPLL